MSTLSVAPFFVENVSELQLNSLKLVTRVSVRACVLYVCVCVCVCVFVPKRSSNVSFANRL